jgi:hypothetical protein
VEQKEELVGIEREENKWLNELYQGSDLQSGHKPLER